MKKVPYYILGDYRIIEKRTIFPLKLDGFISGFFQKVKIRQVLLECRYNGQLIIAWRNMQFVNENEVKKIPTIAHGDNRIVEKITIFPLMLKNYKSGFFENVKIKQRFISKHGRYTSCMETDGEWKNVCFVDKDGNDLINTERVGEPPE